VRGYGTIRPRVKLGRVKGRSPVGIDEHGFAIEQPKVAQQPRATKSKRRRLPRLCDLPIPHDVRPGPGWTEQMREMADHIGPHATLSIVAHFGGQQLYVPRDAKASPFAEIVDQNAAATLAHIYCGNNITIPVGRVAVNRARRAVIVAAVRENRMSVAEAARVVGTSRTYMSHLVNQTDEGQEVDTAARIDQLEPVQRDLFSLPSPK